MSRIRTIKPESSFNEDNFEIERRLGVAARFAWAMLPCHCDREGRFEWKPKALKAQILPYDEGADFAQLLDEWVAKKMVQRYTVDGREYGVVVNFHKHQQINVRECKSRHPAPPCTDEACACTGQGMCTHMMEGKGKEGKGREGKARAEDARAQNPEPPPPPLPASRSLPGHVDINAIVEAINRPRRKRGLRLVNAMTLSGEKAAPYFALVEFFPADTHAESFAAIEQEHESWLATATDAEVKNGHPVAWWLSNPNEGGVRAAALLPKPRKSQYPLLSEVE